MQGYVSNEIWITDPEEWLIQWCKKELTLPNPEYEKKVRMGFWLGNTKEYIRLYTMEHGSLVLPYGLMDELISMGVKLSGAFPISYAVDFGGEDVPLYDYQREAVDKMIRARYGILQSPAGSGKTQMGIAIIKELKRRTLWLTHTRDLLKQSMDRASQYIDNRLIGSITEGKIDIGKGVTFATVQTMSKIDLTKYRDEWDVIITDECHRVAGSPTQMTMFQKVLSHLSARHKYGLSATVHRADGMILATFSLVGPVQHVVRDEAVASKIMRVRIKPVYTQRKDTTGCTEPDGTINYMRLINSLAKDEERNEYIMDHLDNEREHSCLILSDRVEHLKLLYWSLPPADRPLAAIMSATTPIKERAEIIAKMRSGEMRFLFASYKLAAEGLDIPRLDRLFMVTPQKDYAIVVQALGRIARTFPGKGEPVAYDFIDPIRYCERAYRERQRHYRKCGALLGSEQN